MKGKMRLPTSTAGFRDEATQEFLEAELIFSSVSDSVAQSKDSQSLSPQEADKHADFHRD